MGYYATKGSLYGHVVCIYLSEKFLYQKIRFIQIKERGLFVLYASQRVEQLKQQTVEYATHCLRSTDVGNLSPLKIGKLNKKETFWPLLLSCYLDMF